MKNTEAFVRLCIRVIADHAVDLVDLHVVAEKIYRQAQEHPFEDGVHPMLHKVSDLAFDIAEDYRSDTDDRADWRTITDTIKRYSEGNWEQTCWMLTAMYGEYSGETLTHSYSVSVRRQNGETNVETASDELKKELSRAIEKINPQQTDERYLQNLAKFLPSTTKSHGLANVEVGEYLAEPYHTTA